MFKTFSLPLSLALLSAIPVQADPPPAPAAWKSQLTKAAKANSSDNWWQVFNDAELNRLIAESQANYPGLKTALARVDQARAAVRIARAGWFPRFTTVTDIGRSRASDTQYDFSFGTLSNFAITAELAYELDIWGRVRGQVNAARAEAESATANATAMNLILAGEVARVYFALRSVDEEQVVLRETLALRQEALKLATARLEAGATNELDRVRAEAELATTEAEVSALKGPRADLENTLALALGKMASDFKTGASKLPNSIPPVPKVLPSELVQRRPDLMAASHMIHAAQARIGATRADYFPRITLGGNVGNQTSQTDRILDRDSDIWNVGIRFSLPIFVGGQRKAAMDAAQATFVAATTQYQEKVLTAFKEVESLMAKLNAQEQQSTAQTRLQTAADAAAKLARQRYTEGVATYLEVIEAERTSLSARRALVQLRGERLLTTVQLIQALGGGWSQSLSKKP
jgi:outer membrane protein, multidrug efflux system